MTKQNSLSLFNRWILKWIQGSLLLSFLTLLSMNSVAMSDKKEKELGKQMYDEIIANMPIYEEKKMVDYVNKIGQSLVRASERPNYKFTFTIIDSPDINAFATPGGYIYINRGLIAYMTNEAQLAAVLAHEIGHVTGEHASRQQRAATTNKVISGVLGVLTGSGDLAEASALWGQTVVSGYGREMELEADQLGAKYLYAANYPPSAMIDVISLLKDNERFERRRAKETGKKIQSYHGLFATHPRNDQRLKEAVATAGELDANINQTASKTTFRIATDGLPWGKRFPKQIRKENRHYNEKLRFRFDYPEGWQFNQQGKLLVGTNPEQSAQMTVRVLRRTTETPDVYIKKRLGYPLIKKSEPFTMGKLRGHRGFVTPKEGGDDERLAVIYYSRYAYVFQGKALSADMKTADQSFKTMINSFRPLSRQELTPKQEKVIHYVKAKPGLTFEKLSAYLKMDKYGEDQLRLINGYYPVGEPEVGEWVKIIK